MQRVLVAGFYSGLAVMVLSVVLAQDVNPFMLVTASMGAGWVAGLSGVGLLGYAIFTRRGEAWAHVALATLIGGGAVVGAFPLAQRVEHARFIAKRERLDALVRDVLADGRVRSMSDGTRYWKDLNGAALRDVGAPGDTAGPEHARPLGDVLAAQGIDEATYRRLRAGLLDTGYISFEVTDAYVAFVRDGMLDNVFGVVYVRPGHEPPALDGEFVDATQLVDLRHLGGRWYAFGTT